MILMHALFLTKGEWDVGITPKLYMHGINAVSVCDLMMEAMFIPGTHITKDFKTTMGMAHNFGIPLSFYVQRDVRVYKSYKRELPQDVIAELSKPEYTLADPEQGAEGDDTLYVHGIIGEDQISRFEEHNSRKIGSEGMKVTRTYFGDLLHGNSHFLEYPIKNGKVEMKEPESSQAVHVYQLGLEPVPMPGTNAPTLSPEEEEQINDINFLQEITFEQ
jgi:hypothetical protein